MRGQTPAAEISYASGTLASGDAGQCEGRVMVGMIRSESVMSFSARPSPGPPAWPALGLQAGSNETPF
jgi:hypothetical protein